MIWHFLAYRSDRLIEKTETWISFGFAAIVLRECDSYDPVFFVEVMGPMSRCPLLNSQPLAKFRTDKFDCPIVFQIRTDHPFVVVSVPHCFPGCSIIVLVNDKWPISFSASLETFLFR